MLTATDLAAPAYHEALGPGLERLGNLPAWLVAPMQSEAVIAALERHVPEFGSGGLSIRHCKLDRLRLKGSIWEALYVLTIATPDQQASREIWLAGALTPPTTERAAAPPAGPFNSREWRVYLPELRLDLWMSFEDAALDMLPILSDSEQARSLLQQSIRMCSPSYAALQIAHAQPRIARYKPGSRATIVYDLEYAGAASDRRWPALVVAKTYSKDKGRNAYEAMSKLWASPLSKGDLVAIAEPLAYIPEHKVLVQGPVQGDHDLKDLLQSALRAGTASAIEELHAIMHKAGVGLAALHHSGARHGETIAWEDELAEIYAEVGKLGAVLPWFAEATMPLLARLEALAMATPAEPALPSHRSFRPQQVLIDRDRIGFIDFDGFCLAEPALDLALFCATVQEMGINTSPSAKQKLFSYPTEQARQARLNQLDAICRQFLDGYEQCAPVSRQRIALWQALDLLTVVLRCWTKVKPHQLGNAVAILTQHVSSATSYL